MTTTHRAGGTSRISNLHLGYPNGTMSDANVLPSTAADAVNNRPIVPPSGEPNSGPTSSLIITATHRAGGISLSSTLHPDY